MDRTVVQWRFKDGDEVMSADEKRLGKVIALWPHRTAPTHLVVAQGVLRRHHVYIPTSAVTTYDGRHVYVDATKAEISQRGWGRAPLPPAAGGGPAATMATDPVCGMPVERSEASAQGQHQGVLYYFCSRACKQRFEAEPARYLQANPVAEVVASPSEAQHP
jgi:YHS domain-containing protein